MRKNNPYWYKLLKKLKQEKTISTGLTIPYLFGAYKVLGLPFKNIEDLIIQIQNSSIDKYPVIQNCNEIKKHVLAVEAKHEYNKKYGKHTKLTNQKGDCSLIISDNTYLGNHIKEVCKSIINKYQAPIDREEYSWHGNKWNKFNEKEINDILSIKSVTNIR